MLTVARDRVDTSTGRIVIVPNRSLSLQGIAVFFATITAITLLVAGGFTLLGLWPVMAYAIAELIALAVSFHVYLRRTKYAEVISILPDRVILECGGAGKRSTEVFDRYWATVQFIEPESPLQKTRLLVGSHGRHCEVGKCLTDEERRSLGGRLRELIGTVGSIPVPAKARAGMRKSGQPLGHNR